MRNFSRLIVVINAIVIIMYSAFGCSLFESANEVYLTEYSYTQAIMSELPESATPFCENNIPVSGGYHMVMCEDTNEPLGFSAFVKDTDGMYTKVNLLIPDELDFDSAKLLALPSGGGGSGEDTLYLELTTGEIKKYVFFTTSFAAEYWWNYEYRGEATYTTEEVEQLILENARLNENNE